MILMPNKVAMFLRVVDVRDRHDLGILLKDVTMESVLMEEWDDVRSKVSRFTKRKQWVGNEEKKTTESEPVHRAGTKYQQSRFSEMVVEKNVSSYTME